MNKLLDVNNYTIESSLMDMGLFNKNITIQKKFIAQNYKNISYNLSPYLNFDYDELVIEKLSKELKQSFDRFLLKEMSSKRQDYINILNKSDTDIVNFIIEYLEINDYNFIVCPALIGNMIISNYKSNYKSTDSFKHDVVCIIGHIGNITCFIDSLRKYDNKEIICGKSNSFNYNYNINLINVENQEFADKLVMNMNFGVDISDNFTNLVLIDKSNINKYKNIYRDIKIDELLS